VQQGDEEGLDRSSGSVSGQHQLGVRPATIRAPDPSSIANGQPADVEGHPFWPERRRTEVPVERHFPEIYLKPHLKKLLIACVWDGECDAGGTRCAEHRPALYPAIGDGVTWSMK
jgi:hypothetical protein